MINATPPTLADDIARIHALQARNTALGATLKAALAGRRHFTREEAQEALALAAETQAEVEEIRARYAV